MTVSSPNHYIEHITEIDAPIESVWKILININDWEWNKWTRLEVPGNLITEGMQGKLKASYDGNDDWETFDMEFGKISHEEYILEWSGNVGGGCLFSGNHSMRLEKENEHKTKLIHREKFGGMLPRLWLGLPYKKLERNYLLMNESLKAFVETAK